MNDNQPPRHVRPISPDVLRFLFGETRITIEPPFTLLEKAILCVAMVPGLIAGYMFARSWLDGTL